MSGKHFKLAARAIGLLDAIHSIGKPCKLRDLNEHFNVSGADSMRGVVLSLMATGHLGATQADSNVREYFLTAKGRSARRFEEVDMAYVRVARARDGFSSEIYQGSELLPYTGRPRANECLALPSRFGDQLRFRDGRVQEIAR